VNAGPPRRYYGEEELPPMATASARSAKQLMIDMRHVNPLCWYMFFWFFFLYGNSWPSIHGIGRLLIFTLLMLTHLCIYCLLLSLEMRKALYWSAVGVQACLLVFITIFAHHPGVAAGVPIAFIVFLLTKFSNIRFAIGAVIVYSIFPILPLYLKLLSLWAPGNFVIDYSAYTDGIVTFLLLGVVMYLQQNWSRQQVQKLLNELNTAHTRLQSTHQQLAAYAVHVEDLTMQNERQRLARELHDTLSQGLAGLVMQLDAANSYYSKGKGELAQAVVQRTMERARTMLSEMRYVIDDLRTNELLRADDLPELVQEEIDRFSDTTGISCEADLDGLTSTPIQHCAQVLRVITESLTNVARHAQAGRVWVQAIVQECSLAIVVRDDGVGFDPAIATGKVGHYGLVGLRERSRLIGGQLDIESSPGYGTCIRLYVPCSPLIGEAAAIVLEESSS
jgi:NarL family two-component system sensor histidine kinase YdfH